MPLFCLTPIEPHRTLEEMKETGKNILVHCAPFYSKKGIGQDYQLALLDDFSPIWALKTIGYQSNHIASPTIRGVIKTGREYFLP